MSAAIERYLWPMDKFTEKIWSILLSHKEKDWFGESQRTFPVSLSSVSIRVWKLVCSTIRDAPVSDAIQPVTSVSNSDVALAELDNNGSNAVMRRSMVSSEHQ